MVSILYTVINGCSKYNINIKTKTMAKKVIKEMDLNAMIAGGHSSDEYPEYHRQILSGLLNEDSERTEKQHPASSVKPERETEEHPQNQPKFQNKRIRNAAVLLWKNTAKPFCMHPGLLTVNLSL